jgi:hypothetical protein
VKKITNHQGKKHYHFATCQEACWKDIDQPFSVLQVCLLLFEIRLVARQKYPRQQHDCFCQPTQYDHHENVNTSVKPLRDPKRIYAFLETYPRPSIT